MSVSEKTPIPEFPMWQNMKKLRQRRKVKMGENQIDKITYENRGLL